MRMPGMLCPMRIMNRLATGLITGSILLVLLVLGGAGLASAAESELQGKYTEPMINLRLFGDDLSMVNNERDEYATNLAAYAVKVILESSADQESLDGARRLLGLALHLSPRNKKCVVINAQLKRGVLPKKVVADYDFHVFARLLLTRGQLLERQKAGVNRQLARYFIELSASIDPRNEDAVYEAEIRRVDHGSIDWRQITDAKVHPSGLPRRRAGTP